MSGTKQARRGIVADNGYAAVNRTDDSVQVIGWYTPPWIAKLLTPLQAIAVVAAFWIMLRMISPPLARRIWPSVDYPLEAYVNLFRSPIHGWLGRNDWNFGYELTASLLLASLAAMILLFIAAKVLIDQGVAMYGLAYVLRFPLRVEMWKDRIRIGRRVYEKTGIEAFSVGQPAVVKNNRHRNWAYDQSGSIIFETAIANMRVADVFGIERAEGIVLILRGANEMSDSL